MTEYYTTINGLLKIDYDVLARNPLLIDVKIYKDEKMIQNFIIHMLKGEIIK